MTPSEAAKILKNKIKEIKMIKICKDYGKDFLFVAFQTDTPDKELDPFYLVGKIDGKVRKYNIAEDANKFYSAPSVKF